ncbi:glutamate racemase [Thalassotalea sp. 1_MG-2023]|uniref:glutamate racemase n=1 Tax=Thalassotalea sp. 1_MG-2023 TaxID=3062680 RepID=UPI0026E1A309|nr:glutamate racemase [Thalassotalea sp. 1_MG-2023]MDO6426792.1 glutamate racemase [Thalassotalea sp. 1_MG-2023]
MQTQSNNSPIGIFDSGIGGLSIAKCITEQLPRENLIYVADSKFAPYGEQPLDKIIERVNTIAQWFIEQHCKAIVVACNTATVNAIDQLRAKVSIPIIGVEPAIKPAAALSKNKKVGVLVTSATAENPRFLSLINQHKNGASIFVQPCPGLVNMIETGQQDSHECFALLTQFLSPLLANNIDQLVLGCTHYPFVSKQIKHIVGNNVHLLETAQPVTEQLSRQLKKNKIVNLSNGCGKSLFYSNHHNTNHDQLLSTLWSTQLRFTSFI